jgi:hypothetical protein
MGRRPQFIYYIYGMEDDLNLFVNGRHPQKQYKKTIQPERFKIKTIVVAPLRVT